MNSQSGVEVPDPIKVNDVRAQFAVKEDTCLANSLQNHEFSDKYDNNRQNRRTVRSDIPLARSAQVEEEQQLRNRLQQQHEFNRQIYLRDEEIASQIVVQERNNGEKLTRLRESKDAILAQQILQQDYVSDALQRNRTESKDYEVAHKLQMEEKNKYDQRKKAKQLKKEKQRLIELSSSLQNSNLQGSSSGQGSSRERVLRNNGQFEDVGDFNDFYIQPAKDMKLSAKKELQELQDQELARLLQDQERNRGSGDSSRTKADIALMEDTDAALAMVLQKQEKLKADKYMARRKEEKRKKQETSRSSSLPAYPEPPAYINNNSANNCNNGFSDARSAGSSGNGGGDRSNWHTGNNVATRVHADEKRKSEPLRQQSYDSPRHQASSSRHQDQSSMHKADSSTHQVDPSSSHQTDSSRHQVDPSSRHRDPSPRLYENSRHSARNRDRLLPDPKYTNEEQRLQEELHRNHQQQQQHQHRANNSKPHHHDYHYRPVGGELLDRESSRQSPNGWESSDGGRGAIAGSAGGSRVGGGCAGASAGGGKCGTTVANGDQSFAEHDISPLNESHHDYCEPLRVTDKQHSYPQNLHSNNVITAIDPTFRRDTISDRYPVDDYANMADMTSADDVVRGQRRQTRSTKDSRDKSNCKQQ